MADLGFDGNIKVSWVTTIASLTAPTTANITAGVSLEGRLLPDGLTISAETGGIANSKMNSTANSEIVGRGTWTLGIKYVRGDSTDTTATAVEAAMVPGANGFLVVRRDKSSTIAWTVGDKVEIYPAQIGYANPDSPAADTLQAVEVPMKNTGEPKDITRRVALV